MTILPLSSTFLFSLVFSMSCVSSPRLPSLACPPNPIPCLPLPFFPCWRTDGGKSPRGSRGAVDQSSDSQRLASSTIASCVRKQSRPQRLRAARP
ncbi:hypothetical protein SEVIR_3G060301v4 [Setaria viridis]|uniref:Secreted protein n=1 Tax=Setaria viridis TaxID=4556 RepID=A0A4U6V907_SETVI|nr:hypothetical protein SEVIR_3G060301v2 [Setaria viridis]